MLTYFLFQLDQIYPLNPAVDDRCMLETLDLLRRLLAHQNFLKKIK